MYRLERSKHSQRRINTEKTQSQIVPILSLVLAIVSVIANVLIGYLNNQSQERIKNIELSYSYKQSAILNLSEVINQIVNCPDEKGLKIALAGLDEACLKLSIYIPKELFQKLVHEATLFQLNSYTDYIKLLSHNNQLTMDDYYQRGKFLLNIGNVRDQIQEYLFPTR